MLDLRILAQQEAYLGSTDIGSASDWGANTSAPRINLGHSFTSLILKFYNTLPLLFVTISKHIHKSQVITDSTMAPLPKSKSELSTNIKTTREREWRASKTGFDRQVMLKKRSNQESIGKQLRIFKQTTEFKDAPPDKQKEFLAAKREEFIEAM